MSPAAGCMGWLVAAALGVAVIRLRRRLELVARAEHELRGPLTAFALGLDAARGSSAGRRLAAVLDAELARARAGLADLAAARQGRRAAPEREPVRVDRLLRSSAAAWAPAAQAAGRRLRMRSTAGRTVVRGDRSRLAQALGNVMANAVEHGDGDVSVHATREADRLRIEVTNPTGDRNGLPDRGRGRGLSIAADAAADGGGTLTTAVGPRRASAILDLPLEP
jgi:signal transduction histidine kinase